MTALAREQRWGLPQDAIAALGVLALWLVTRAYRGVRHDGILYMGQVLDRLMPDRFGHDLFFAFGSQDRYSLFSPLVAPLVARFGIGATALAGVAACHVLFLVGCWMLTRDWPSRALRWAALALVAVLPHTYGGLGEFSFAEPFFTARSLAEPFVLIALALLLQGRIALALPFVALGAAFHPLLTLPAIVVGWIHLSLARPRTWALGAVAFVLPLLGAVGIAPFDAIWHRFDAEWWSVVSVYSLNAFISHYHLLDWAPFAFDALVLVLFAARCPVPTLARFARAVLIAATGLTVLWGVGADVLHDVLLTQLQLWRVYWLMHLLSLLALPWIAAQLWAEGWTGRWAVAALALAGIAVMSNWATGYLCIAWAGAALAAVRWPGHVSRSLAIAASVVSLLGILAVSFKVASTTLDAIAAVPDNFGNVGAALVLLGLPACGLLIAVLLLAALGRGRAARAAAAAVAGALALYGATMWDQRSEWQRRLEASLESGPPAFDGVLPAGADVYWADRQLITPWLLARAPSYFSEQQGSGLLFNRGTSLEYVRREQAVSGLIAARDACLRANMIATAQGAPASACVPTPSMIADTCRQPLHPDWLVFGEPLALPAVAEWHWLSPRGRGQDKRWFLYTCPRS